MFYQEYNHILRLPKQVWQLLFLVISLFLYSCEGADTKQPSNIRLVSDYLPEREAYVRPATLIQALEAKDSYWVDSVFNSLTQEERIAQLIIIEAFSDQGPKYEADVLRLIKKYKVGGLIYFQGGPVRQAKLTNKYQAASKVPLYISMDAETGVGMRLDSTVHYPFQQMLGAVADNGLIYTMGAQVADEFKRLGMHINFAPVADINNNSRNPIISYRAFGEDRQDVTGKSLAYMKGMQENGIIAVAKHFPGHGDTNVDSHLDLPVIPFTRTRLDSMELYPFKELIKQGIGGIMVAHMHIPKLDATQNLPSTLSQPIVNGVLKRDLAFKGLVFTDAMVMKGVTKYFEPGEAEARALIAGNDVIERLKNVPKAIAAIKQAVAQGDLSQEELDLKCRRVLKAKQWLGLDNYKPIDLENLHEDLNTGAADSTNRAIAEAGVTLLIQKKNLIPLKAKKYKRIATVSFGVKNPSIFQEITHEKINTTDFMISRKAKAKETQQLWNKLKKYDLVLVSLYGPSIRPSNNLGYSEEATELVSKLALSNKAHITLFDNAYALTQFPEIEKSMSLIVAYQPHYHAQEATVKLLFGKVPARGKLPVTVNKYFAYGDGISKSSPFIASN